MALSSAPACECQCVGKGRGEVSRPLEVQESGLKFSFALSVSSLSTIAPLFDGSQHHCPPRDQGTSKRVGLNPDVYAVAALHSALAKLGAVGSM